MPSTLTYPGVYIEEIPSGVRTISGVATSITAFVGAAARGPVDRAVRIFNFGDYERIFGGLSAKSEMSYAVRQFYTNGGGEAWVIRVVGNATAASTILAAGVVDVLRLTAVDEGEAGRSIRVRVDHDAAIPGSNFNLTVEFPGTNPSESRTETYPNVSMNSGDPRYVVTLLQDSALVRGERIAAAMAGVTGAGRSDSAPLVDGGGNLVDVATLVTAQANTLQVSVDGGQPQLVTLNPGSIVGTNIAKLQAVAAAIDALPGVTCTAETGVTPTFLRIVSGSAGEGSSVRVLPGPSNDVSAALKLGSANGGTEVDAVAVIRPSPVPARATLTGSGAPSVTTPIGAGHERIAISLDGYGPDLIKVDYDGTTGAVADRRARIAPNLQQKVRQARPTNPAYAGFSARLEGGNLVLESGTRGTGSSIMVSAAPGDPLAADLSIVGTGTFPTDRTLSTGGVETPLDPANQYGRFIGSRAQRKGIYALESVDLFNLVCLPGVTDPGILTDTAAYCQERRAFFIMDTPRTALTPDAVVNLVSGTTLPKSDHAALYYPWVWIADPLAGGKLRLTAPSGTVAGVYARTDATRGVWKAPAGTEASLRGVQKVDYALTDLENGIINQQGANALRVFPVVGPVAWGARTMRGADMLASEYKYIPIRRLALYIEETLYRNTQWVVFEPNDEPLWSQIRLNIGAFMNGLFRQGAFQGNTPAKAYLVKCDAETTTQYDIDRGIVNILVAFAPLKPAEFVVIRIQQKAQIPA
ncbi:MAG TPA: phage tail sheath C-terminal domain-containing protein [Longimicrobium sp.]|nr:phage tail sheath C-terminal domain-containing protein [Longimicrobium sp.]